MIPFEEVVAIAEETAARTLIGWEELESPSNRTFYHLSMREILRRKPWLESQYRELDILDQVNPDPARHEEEDWVVDELYSTLVMALIYERYLFIEKLTSPR